MVEHPHSTVRFQPGTSSLLELDILASEEWIDRIQRVCSQWLAATGQTELPIQRLELQASNRPHQGFGSGTQISSLVAHALIASSEAPSDPSQVNFTLEQLASIGQRGLRSHIGLAGYLHGGAILDFGVDDLESPKVGPLSKSSGASAELTILSPREMALSFPDWPVLLFQCSELVGEHGDVEKGMFQKCSGIPNAQRTVMLDLMERELAPALLETDWERWDSNIGVYGYLAGMIFEKVQGGAYRTPEIADAVDFLRKLDCEGAVQSSWGPTVVVVAKDLDHADFLKRSIEKKFPTATTKLTLARNKPTSIEPYLAAHRGECFGSA